MTYYNIKYSNHVVMLRHSMLLPTDQMAELLKKCLPQQDYAAVTKIGFCKDGTPFVHPYGRCDRSPRRGEITNVCMCPKSKGNSGLVGI